MPVMHIDLIEGQYSDAQCRELLEKASALYAEVLESPVERVRVFINLVSPNMAAAGGKVISDGGVPAPHFHFLVMQGRPQEAIDRLITGFTDLIENILGTDRKLIRGGCYPIPAEHWGIGGTSAAVMRAKEIEARAKAAKAG